MRNGLVGFVTTLALASMWPLAIDGCGGGSAATGTGGARGGSSGTGGASGGTPGTGGSSGGSVGSCTSVTPCGGSVVGTWTVTSSCLTVSGSLAPSSVGLSCASASVNGSLQVTGALTANADGTYADNTVTSGTEQFTLAKSCLVISSTPIGCDQAANVIQVLGFAQITCTTNGDGSCGCTGTIQQTGGIGLLSQAPSTSGNYTTSGNTVTLSGDSANGTYASCVSGTKWTLTPQSTTPATTGSIVLQKGSASGTGGTVGTGGNGAGGTNSTGGGNGAGGSNGGSVGTGGNNGGSTGTGGAKGGNSGTGGASTGGAGGAKGGSSGSVGAGGNSTGGTTGTGGASSTGGTAGSGSGTGPCDVFAAAGTPCVAAHSTVRALFAGYSNPLYQVKKASDGTTKDIPLLAGTGIADASVQEAFCGTAAHACTISIIYDQTGNGNDLKVAHVCPTCSGGQPDVEAFADGNKISIGGHTAYGLHIIPCGANFMNPNQTGYRCDTAKKIATGDQPESVYMVVDGVNAGSGCCFDYGNASPTDTASGNMDAVEFSKNKYWGYGAGGGPWVAADLEAGVYSWNGASGNWQNPNSLSLPDAFVTALLKSNQNGKTGGPFVLKGGNGQSGALTAMWNGARPNGYATLNKQGAIVLGIGGDNAAGAGGNFYEGALTASFNADTTDDSLQANIVGAGYGK